MDHTGRIEWREENNAINVYPDETYWMPYAKFEREKLKELGNGRIYMPEEEGKSYKLVWDGDSRWVRERNKKGLGHLIEYSREDYDKDSESNRLRERARFLKAVCEKEGVEWLPHKKLPRNEISYLSSCCGDKDGFCVSIGSDESTWHYECSECKKPCDVRSKEWLPKKGKVLKYEKKGSCGTNDFQLVKCCDSPRIRKHWKTGNMTCRCDVEWSPKEKELLPSGLWEHEKANEEYRDPAYIKSKCNGRAQEIRGGWTYEVGDKCICDKSLQENDPELFHKDGEEHQWRKDLITIIRRLGRVTGMTNKEEFEDDIHDLRKKYLSPPK